MAVWQLEQPSSVKTAPCTYAFAWSSLRAFGDRLTPLFLRSTIWNCVAALTLHGVRYVPSCRMFPRIDARRRYTHTHTDAHVRGQRTTLKDAPPPRRLHFWISPKPVHESKFNALTPPTSTNINAIALIFMYVKTS
ncbi:unnamed protein product [Toxocara canis]|uniref:Secreted protein n=1 Tax=Toxocara canis TaxID=6265 RepID=A0A183U3S5_TOXCA|nr:unnamed protein product [Toxocara canis]